MPSKTKMMEAWLLRRFVFTKAVFFIWGLVVGHSIVEYAVMSKLMLFLEYVMEESLMVSGIIINAFDGLSSLSPFLAAYVADALTNCFNVSVFSTGAYAMGLILLWITGKEPNMLYVALVLIALGKSGRCSTLQFFLHDQLMRKMNGHTVEIPDREDQNAGNLTEKPHTDDVDVDLVPTRIWWHSAWVCGSVIALCALGNDAYYYSLPSWLEHIKISALLMGTIYLVFYSGFCCYVSVYIEAPPRRPFGIILRELKPNSYKELLLWTTFMGYSLVLATGNTLFIAQTARTDLGNNPMVSVSLFFVLKSFISDTVVFLFWCLKAKKKDTNTIITMVRIGAGMICAVSSCVIAREVELHRLNSIRKEAIGGGPMSVLRLIPQYCLLGVMEGLAGGGFVTYNQARLSEPLMRSFITEPFSELVLCAGKFGSILVMFIFRQHINNGRMDKYFLMLAIISSAFFCFYLFWSILNYGDSMGKGSQASQSQDQGIHLQVMSGNETANDGAQARTRRTTLRMRSIKKADG